MIRADNVAGTAGPPQRAAPRPPGNATTHRPTPMVRALRVARFGEIVAAEIDLPLPAIEGRQV